MDHPERIVFSIVFGMIYFAYLFYSLYRRSVLRAFVTPKVICTDLSIAPEDPMSLIRLRGRRGGAMGWLEGVLGISATYEMHVSSRLITLKTPSMFSEGHVVIPVNRVNAVSCSYHVPLRYILHWAAVGAVLNLWHGGSMIAFMGFLGYVHALASSSMRLAVSSGEGFLGFHYVVGGQMPKELVFRTLEALRVLLVRTQDKIPMPLLPPPMAAPAPLLAPPVHGPAPLSPAATSMTG